MSDFDIKGLQSQLITTDRTVGARQFGDFDDSIESTLSKIAGASFRNDNLIASTAGKLNFEIARSALEVEPDFDYFDKVPSDLFMFRDRFAMSRSQDEIDLIATKLRQEQTDKQILADNPWRGFAMNILASALDPTVLLPVGQAYRAGKGAVNASKSILSTAGLSAGAVGLQELGLQPTQEIRTAEESVYNVLGAAVVGGALRGVGVSFGEFRNRAAKDVSNVYQGKEPEALIDGDGNLSAAAINLQDIAKNNKFTSGIAGVLAAIPLNPITRLYKSTLRTANAASELLFSQNLPMAKNLPENGGIAREVSVESFIKTAYGKMNNKLRAYQDIFFEAAGVESGPFKGIRSKVAGLSFDKWDNAVSEAIIDGGVHSDPFVQRGAQYLMRNVFDPLRDEAIRLGLLPKNVTPETANAYFMRMYNTQKIKERPGEFAKAIKPYFVQQNELRISMKKEIAALKGKVKVAKTELSDINTALNVEKINLRQAIEAQKAIAKKIRTAKKTRVSQKAKKEADAANKKVEELNKRIEAIKEEARVAKEKLEAAQKTLDDGVPNTLKDSNGNIRKIMNDEELNAAIAATIDNIINENTNKLRTFGSGAARGKPKPLKSRQFLIPDKVIRGWTIGSASEVANRYVQNMVPTIQFAKMGERLGLKGRNEQKIERLKNKEFELEEELLNSGLTEAEVKAKTAELAEVKQSIEDFKDPINANDIYKYFFEELKAEKDSLATSDPKSQAKLQKQFESNMKDIEAGIDILMGVYGKKNGSGNAFNRALDNIRKYNVLIRMGGVALSSATDTGILVMRNGPVALMRDGMTPILKNNIATIENKALLQDLGFAINQYNGQRIKSMLDYEDVVQGPSKVSKILDDSVQGFMNLTGMNKWQDMMQTMAGSMSISRTLRDIDGWAKTGVMDKDNAKRLNALGLGQEHWKELHNQWKKHGGIEDGSYYARWDEFDIDTPQARNAYQRFKAALYDDVTSTIVEPKAGDLPLFARTPAGRVLLQFKTFFMATHNNLLLSGLSQGDANFYMGIATMVALGDAVYVAKEKLRGNDDIDMSPTKLAQEGFDRAGLFGVFQETLAVGSQLIGPNGGPSRYSVRGLWSTLLGPTAGTFEDIMVGAGKLGKDDFSRTDAEKMKRLLPYMNLFYIDYLTKKIAGDTAVALGARETE